MPTNNYTDYMANCSGSVSNDFITLRITAAIPDKIVVVIVILYGQWSYHDHLTKQ